MYDLSIIVCVYNLANYIKKCLDSIFNQSHVTEKVQVIVVDDGSTDNTQEILSNYKHTIKVISKKNGGIRSARNVGLDSCRKNTRYGTFIDCDDTITDNYIETFYEIIDENSADIIEFNVNFIFEQFGKIKKKTFESSYSNNRMNELTDSFLKSRVKDAQWFVWCRFYKINMFDNITFPLGRRYEDLITIPLIYLNAKTVYSSDKILYNYFKNEGSITNLAKFQDIEDMYYAYLQFSSNCKKAYIIKIFNSTVIKAIYKRTLFIKNDSFNDLAKNISRIIQEPYYKSIINVYKYRTTFLLKSFIKQLGK